MAATAAGGAGNAGNASASVKPQIIGQGSYGVVIKPAFPNTNSTGKVHEYPENVTKLFFKKSGYNQVLNVASRLPGIFGPNNGHRIYPYSRSFTFKNLPMNLQSKFKSVDPNTKLYPVRMPNLGKSLNTLSTFYKELRVIPVRTILSQIQKLLHQLLNAKKEGYIHGDVRETNIMINPATGIMTLIDFDFLHTVEDFLKMYPFGFYCHPPETMILFHMKKRDVKLYFKTADEYIKHINNSFGRFLTAYYQPKINWDLIEPIKDRTEDKIMAAADESDEIKNILKTFDSFGLALTMLEMLTWVYPGCTASDSPTTNKAAFVEGLRARLSASTESVEKSADLILQVVHSVLIPLSDFDYETRMTIDRAVELVDTILSTPASVDESFVGGGGATPSVTAVTVEAPVLPTKPNNAVKKKTRKRRAKRRAYNSSRKR